MKIVEIMYLFDDTSPFHNFYEFEKLMRDFFAQHNTLMEGASSIEGSQARRVYVVKTMPKMEEEIKNPVGRPQTLKGKIRELSDRKLRKPAIEFQKGNK